MRISNTYLFVFFFLTQITFGQTKEAKQISGKILAESTSVEAVNVINNTTQRTTVSDANGLFSIVVNEGDVLIFSAVNLESLRKKITKQDLLLDVVKVQMTAKSIDLKEVIINEHPEITAENIGVIPYGQKKYTPAERKLYTATSGGGIDGLLNSISGRKAMLKKEIVVEQKEQLLVRIDYLFEEKYYVETLKIPVDYIRGFQYYCIDDTSLAAALRSKNKTMVMFLIVQLAEKYNQIIKDEN